MNTGATVDGSCLRRSFWAGVNKFQKSVMRMEIGNIFIAEGK